MKAFRAVRAAKYGNKPTDLDGRRFASRAEARRYAELRVLERAGDIAELALQPRYPLRIGAVLVCTYVADFSYRTRDGALVVEDVKSVATRTAAYRIKAKLLLALHGISIAEIHS